MLYFSAFASGKSQVIFHKLILRVRFEQSHELTPPYSCSYQGAKKAAPEKERLNKTNIPQTIFVFADEGLRHRPNQG
jgi:hypothetical protein